MEADMGARFLTTAKGSKEHTEGEDENEPWCFENTAPKFFSEIWNLRPSCAPAPSPPLP